MTDNICTEFPAGCSCMKLTSKQGHPYWFRTCDLDTDIWELGAHIVALPAGETLTTATGSLSVRYALTGITYHTGDTWLLDGINSEGLAGGLLFLEEGTSALLAAPDRTGVMGMELVTTLLATCRDTAEVYRAAETIQVLDIPMDAGPLPATLHCFFTDAAGGTVILEATDPKRPGQLLAYREDSIGVMTNSPPYPAQLDNLRWFLSQSPELHYGGDDCPIRQPAWEGVRLAADPTASHVSQSGVFPGSYAACDRFIRLAVLKALNQDGRWMDDAQMLPLGSSLLHTVFEPHNRGVFHHRRTGYCRDGYTQYAVMYDLTQRRMYLQPWDATAWYCPPPAGHTAGGITRRAVPHEAMSGVVPLN